MIVQSAQYQVCLFGAKEQLGGQKSWACIIWKYTFLHVYIKTSQELRMLSSVTINCQVTKIVMNPGSQLSVL